MSAPVVTGRAAWRGAREQVTQLPELRECSLSGLGGLQPSVNLEHGCNSYQFRFHPSHGWHLAYVNVYGNVSCASGVVEPDSDLADLLDHVRSEVYYAEQQTARQYSPGCVVQPIAIANPL